MAVSLLPDETEELFQEPADIEDIYSEAIDCWDACSQDNIFDKTLQFYTKLYLQDGILIKADRASMMNSLEVRSPYLDGFCAKNSAFMEIPQWSDKIYIEKSIGACSSPRCNLSPKDKDSVRLSRVGLKKAC